MTKVSILTPPKLSSVNIAFLACEDYLSCQVGFPPNIGFTLSFGYKSFIFIFLISFPLHGMIEFSFHQRLLLEAKTKLGEILSAFEFLDTNAMDVVRDLRV